jgi:6-phosphofructokinase 2
MSPKITAHSTVGAGDSMVAGLAYAFAQHQAPDQALKLAVACGAGTAKKPGTQLFNTKDIENLTQKIEIKTLDI